MPRKKTFKVSIQRIALSGRKRKYNRPVQNIGNKKSNNDVHATCLFESTYNTQTEYPDQGSYQKALTAVKENWAKIRDLLSITRIEEMRPQTFKCGLCETVEKEIIFCLDCSPMSYYCHQCAFKVHANVLFHCQQKWRGTMYVPVLTDITLHRMDGHNCEKTLMAEMIIVDQKGRQHAANVEYCLCEDFAVTLLRYNLWPSTPVNPRVAFDLRFMELLAVLQLESRVSAKSFCDAIEMMETFFVNVHSQRKRNIYRLLVGDCLAEYNHHRSGLFNLKGIIDQLFCTECPVCQKNPDIICLDGNFGLVHRKSAGTKLSRTFCRHGDVFFADQEEVDNFVEHYQIDKRKSQNDCSEFQAGSIIRSKLKTKKLDVTGVFGSICKHNVPLVFLNMTQGERLAYPIFIMKKILRQRDSTDKLIVMYDISCTLHRHIQNLPASSLKENCEFVVPVFHSYAHNMKCQIKYGQRNVTQTGLTDGEGIERFWSMLRPFNKITKEMSLNNRHDFLTECLLHQAKKTIFELGNTLSIKYKKSRQIIDENSPKLDKILKLLNKKKEEIPMLKKKWVNEIENNTNQDLELTPAEVYWENEKLIERKRLSLEVANQGQREVLRKEIERLMSKNEIIKRKKKIKLDTAIDSTSKKRKLGCLQKLKNLAALRQHLATSMKKYAEGQSIAIRISREFAKINQKMKKIVEMANAVLDPVDSLRLEDCLSPTNEVFNEVDGVDILSPEEIKCIELSSTIDRAKHEESTLKCEFEKMNIYIVHFYKMICKKLSENISEGCSHFLHCMLHKLEVLMSSMKNDEIISGEFSIVTNILTTEFCYPLLQKQMTTDEINVAVENDNDYRDIYSFIEYGYDADYDDDYDDDDYDDDDDDDDDDADDIYMNESIDDFSQIFS